MSAINIVNTVWKSKTDEVLKHDLEHYTSQLKKCRHLISVVLHKSMPQQLVIKFDQGTMLMFSTGTMRIMGKCDDLDAHFKVYEI